jgi:hypothetical protein
MPPVKAKLVTIIAAYEYHDAVRAALHKRGIKAFSVSRSEGEGTHGPQRDGLAGNANYVFTVVTTEAHAADLLSWVDRDLVHKHHPAIAYAMDVEAILGSAPGGGHKS